MFKKIKHYSDSDSFWVTVLVFSILIFFLIFLPPQSRLAALQALGGSSALYCGCLAGKPFEKLVTFSAFSWTSFFLCFYSHNYWGTFLCLLFVLLKMKNVLPIDILFILLFCSVHISFQDSGLKEMSLALFSQLAFLYAFINPRSKKNCILLVLLFGLGGLQALTQSPKESWGLLFLNMSESFFLFPMQGAGVLFFLFSSQNLRDHLAFNLFYLLNGLVLLIVFQNKTQMASAFLSFFLFLHFIICVCILVRLKRKKLPMSDFQENWNNFLLKVKMEFIPVLYIGVTFYFNSFYPTTNKWIIGVNSLVVQIVILLVY